MALIKKNIKIATVLPYKENYTFKKASAASLWVSEYLYSVYCFPAFGLVALVW